MSNSHVTSYSAHQQRKHHWHSSRKVKKKNLHSTKPAASLFLVCHSPSLLMLKRSKTTLYTFHILREFITKQISQQKYSRSLWTPTPAESSSDKLYPHFVWQKKARTWDKINSTRPVKTQTRIRCDSKHTVKISISYLVKEEALCLTCDPEWLGHRWRLNHPTLKARIDRYRRSFKRPTLQSCRPTAQINTHYLTTQERTFFSKSNRANMQRGEYLSATSGFFKYLHTDEKDSVAKVIHMNDWDRYHTRHSTRNNSLRSSLLTFLGKQKPRCPQIHLI